MRSTFELLAYAWGCTGETPTDADLALLGLALRRFPHAVNMAREIAGLFERAGRRDEAANAARIALAWLPSVVSEADRAELRRLARLSGAEPRNEQPGG